MSQSLTTDQKPPTAPETLRQRQITAWLAIAFAVLLGAAWQVATRHGASHGFAPMDLALLRYGIPALLLSPLWWRSGLMPKNFSKKVLLVLVCGAGLPYGLLAMTGARYAPVAHMGALITGLMPVMVILLSWLVLRQKPIRLHIFSAAIIAVGAGLVTEVWRLGGQSIQQVLTGDVLFIVAAALWAMYTLALRGAGLSAWTSTAIISAWSALGSVPLWCFMTWGTVETSYLPKTMLLDASPQSIAVQVLVQGVLAGAVAMFAIAHAVQVLGPRMCAAMGAAVPVLSSLGGVWLLGEPVQPAAALGMLLVSGGILALAWKR